MSDLGIFLLFLALALLVCFFVLLALSMVGVALYFLVIEPLWRRWKGFRRRQWLKGLA